MFFNKKSIQVYRLEAPIDNLSDPEYILVATIQGGVQPFTGDEAIHQGQGMENIRDLVVFDSATVDIKKSDELIYDGDTRRVAYIERFSSGVLPHTEVYTTDSQWDRNG